MKLLFFDAGADGGLDEYRPVEEVWFDAGWDEGPACGSAKDVEACAGRPLVTDVVEGRRTEPADDADAVALIAADCGAAIEADGAGWYPWEPPGTLFDDAGPSAMLLKLMCSLGEGKDMAGWGACTVMSRSVH